MIRRLIKRAAKKVGILNAPPHASDDFIPSYTITDEEGSPYLTRWYLFRSERFRVFLHKFYRSDDDRALHDHPWSFVTILLHGMGYYEHTPEGVDYHPPFSIGVRLNPTRPHRVELERTEDGREHPQWTLFIAGRNVRKWGFHVSVDQMRKQGLHSMLSSRYIKGAYIVLHDAFLSNKFDGTEGTVQGLQED